MSSRSWKSLWFDFTQLIWVRRNLALNKSDGVRMLQAGDRAPEFELADDHGRIVRLSELLAHGPLVLYFYPADFTPVCTKEACMFRDAHADLAAQGIRVFGVSPRRLMSKRNSAGPIRFLSCSYPTLNASRSGLMERRGFSVWCAGFSTRSGKMAESWIRCRPT